MGNMTVNLSSSSGIICDRAVGWYLKYPFRSTNVTTTPFYDMIIDIQVQAISIVLFVGIASLFTSWMGTLAFAVGTTLFVTTPQLITVVLLVERVRTVLGKHPMVVIAGTFVFGSVCLWLSRFPLPIKRRLFPDGFDDRVDDVLFFLEPTEEDGGRGYQTNDQ